MSGAVDGAYFEARDPRFAACYVAHMRVERLWTGARWCEGPAYFPAHRALVWSDVPNDRLLRLDEATGAVGEFRRPSGHANGNVVDREGRLVTCEHHGRRVTRTEHDGSLTVLADRYEGRPLNSPNDVVVASDGAVWFTDPPYGILSDYEGVRAPIEQAANRVYRLDPGGALEAVADDFVMPNGLAFSPDEAHLYVSDTGGSHAPDGPRHIRKLRVVDGRRLANEGVFAVCDAGFFDGFRFDEDGRLWAGAGDGARCYHPDGTHLGTVRTPETVANLAFGGPRRNRLYLCGHASLYAAYTTVRGAVRPGTA